MKALCKVPRYEVAKIVDVALQHEANGAKSISIKFSADEVYGN